MTDRQSTDGAAAPPNEGGETPSAERPFALDDAAGRTHSRLRTILAIVVCTLVPAWLLVAALHASIEPLLPPLFVALGVSLVRAVTVASRWLALGPGRRWDRAIWGIFIVAMLMLASIAAFDKSGTLGASMLIPYFVMQTIYWRVAGFIGERENIEERSADSRFGLQDALVVLALFCIVVAGIRAYVDPRQFYVSFEIAFGFLAFCYVVPFVGLVPFLCDLGMRAAIRSRSPHRRRIGTAMVGFLTIVAIVCALGASIDNWRTDFLMPTFAFVLAYVVYAALQESVLSLSGLVATDDPVPSDGERV